MEFGLAGRGSGCGYVGVKTQPYMAPQIMSRSRPSVGVVWKCWAGKVKVSPTGLIWEERGAESSSQSHTQKKITIKHNYRLKTVGKGALYLPILAQHSTVPLIATLLLVHIAFCASCHILLRHARGIPSVHSTALKTERLWNRKALKFVLFAHNLFIWLFYMCPICTVCPPATV